MRNDCIRRVGSDRSIKRLLMLGCSCLCVICVYFVPLTIEGCAYDIHRPNTPLRADIVASSPMPTQMPDRVPAQVTGQKVATSNLKGPVVARSLVNSPDPRCGDPPVYATADRNYDGKVDYIWQANCWKGVWIAYEGQDKDFDGVMDVETFFEFYKYPSDIKKTIVVTRGRDFNGNVVSWVRETEYGRGEMWKKATGVDIPPTTPKESK